MPSESRLRARDAQTLERTVSRQYPWWPGWPSLREVVTSVLAIGIVAYTGAALWVPLTSGSQEASQHTQTVMALLGPILGTVVGYYFGTASGERVAQQATQRVGDAIEGKIEAERLSADRLAQLEEAQPVVEQSAELLAYLLSRLQALESSESAGGNDAEGDQSEEAGRP